MQSPSSLIFLVLLGVWAAYFVQYWVRRRDHVSTARSVEQFSEAMRVLERRDPLPRTDLSEQAPRSYAVHPARASRPQVLVKRAVAAEAPGPVTVTARVEDREVVGAGSRSATGAVGSGRPLGADPVGARHGGTSQVGRGSAGGDPGGRSGSAGGRPERSLPVRAQVRPSRRVRGILVLVALVEMLVIVPLVIGSMLPFWALGTSVLALGGALVFLRSGVRAEHAMVRAHRRRQAHLARQRAAATAPSATRRPQGRPAPAARTASGATASGATASGATASTRTAGGRSPSGATAARATASGSTTSAETASGATASGATASWLASPTTTGLAAEATATRDVAATASPAPGPERVVGEPRRSPLDVALEVEPATEAGGPVVASTVVAPRPEAPVAEVMVPILDEDDMPLTWDPVPVPRPTYTMKAKAERREVAPAAVTPDPAPVVREDAEHGDSAYDQRRVAGA